MKLNEFSSTLCVVALSAGTAMAETREVVKVEKGAVYKVQIDCYSPHMSDTGTEDTIKVKFTGTGGRDLGTTTLSGSQAQLSTVGLTTQANSPMCDAVGDAVYYSTSVATSDKGMDAVNISTSGSDGFWMDEVYLIKQSKVKTTYRVCNTTSNGVPVCVNESKTDESEATLAHWGRDNGKGYCLSMDRNDGAGDWKNYVDASVLCAPNLTFKVSGTKVFAPSGREMVPLSDYKVSIFTGTDSGAGTDSNIFLTINGSAGNTGEMLLNPLISGNAFENGDTDTINLNQRRDVGKVTSVKLRSDGSYAGSGWQVKKVSVVENGTTKTLNCKNVWVDGGSITCK